MRRGHPGARRSARWDRRREPPGRPGELLAPRVPGQTQERLLPLPPPLHGVVVHCPHPLLDPAPCRCRSSLTRSGVRGLHGATRALRPQECSASLGDHPPAALDRGAASPGAGPASRSLALREFSPCRLGVHDARRAVRSDWPPCVVFWTLALGRSVPVSVSQPTRDESRRCAAHWCAQYAAGQDSSRANGCALASPLAS